jgi:NAD(P)-dependent dehydrogenase (short-subunit alcohol dehydrogenase family)
VDKAQRAIDACRAAGAGVTGAVPVACELSEPSSVRACVEAVKKIGAPLDAIIANAGIMAPAKLEVKHGLEIQFLTNHVGHFILVTGLTEQLSDDGRVVVVASSAHRRAPRVGIDFDNLAGERSYDRWQSYGRSKFANILFASELARRFAADASVARARRTANSLHPGVIGTDLTRNLPGAVASAWTALSTALLKSIPQGAATQCYVACHPDVAGVSGKYFADCNVAEPRRLASNAELAKRLWDETERIAARLA